MGITKVVPFTVLTILYYTILYYTILYYTILYYTILYYTILYCTVPSNSALLQYIDMELNTPAVLQKSIALTIGSTMLQKQIIPTSPAMFVQLCVAVLAWGMLL